MTHAAIRHLILPLLCSGAVSFGVLLAAATTPDERVEGLQAKPGQGGAGAAANPATVEFFVTTSDGQAVTDLKPEEVTVRIAGRERKIQALELKRFTAGAGGAAAAGLPAPFGTNVAAKTGGAPSRVYFFVIEDQSVRPGDERPIHAMVEKLLGSLAPTDRVGLLTTPNATVRIEPTTDHARVRKALAAITGQRPGSTNSNDRNCRTRDSLAALRNAMPLVQSEDGLATVVFFSAAMEQASAASTSLENVSCLITTDLFNNVARAGAAARAHLFVIQADESVTSRSEGLETLASVGGGGSVLPLVSSGDPLERIARETAAYYVAKFATDADDRVGAGQRLEVRVSRTGVQPRTYGEYTFRAGAAPAGAAAGSPRDMLKSPAQFGDVPIRVAGFPSRAADGKVRVLVLVEPGTPETKFAAAAVGIIDAKNQMRQVALDEKQLAASPAIVAFELDPGPYRLRAAATDAAGKGGTADHSLDATLKDAGTIKLSAMLLGAARATGFAPVLQFKDEEQAIVYVEAYGDLGSGKVSAKAELAGADGKVIQEVQPGGSGTKEPDRVILTAAIPLKELKPGDYTVRLRFQLEGQPEGVVSHTLRKIQ